MPPVAGAVLAGVAGGFSLTAAGTIAFSLQAALIAGAKSLVLGLASAALTPKSKKSGGGGDFAASSAGLTQTLRQPLVSHKIVYGQTRVGGALAYAGMTNNNDYLHLVVILAAHEVESIDEIWINDYPVPVDALDGSGNVTSGRYSGLIRVRKKLGASDQGADSVTVAEIPEWTNNHKLQGRAYIIVRLQYNQDKFPGGTPNISAFIKGRKVYDSRIDETRFTTNAALFQYDYMADAKYGLNAGSVIDETVLQASANISDEIVDVEEKDFTVTAVATSTDILTISGTVLETYIGDRVQFSSTGTLPTGISADTDYYIVPYQFKDTCRVMIAETFDDALTGTTIDISGAGSGVITMTKTGEPRYHGSGILDTEKSIEENIRDLLTATAGRAIYVGGKWKIKVAAYESPSIEIDENDIIDSIKIKTALSQSDRFNGVKGVYRSPYNLENPSDWPALVSTTFAGQDGETILRDIDMPYTPRPQSCRRINKIELLKSRQEITCRITCNLRAMRVECGSTVQLTISKYGWEQKEFEVTSFALIPRTDSNNPGIAVSLDLRETAEAVYDWATSEESDIDPAPNSTLPDVFTVTAPTGVSFDSRPVSTVGGDNIYIIGLRWTAHPDSFVINGGKFEIQFRKDGEIEYRPGFFANGDITATDIIQASVGDEYDVRIRAWNNLAPGVRSEWVTLTGVIAGSGGGVTETADWGLFSEAGGDDDEDWELFSDAVGSTDDWGAWA